MVALAAIPPQRVIRWLELALILLLAWLLAGLLTQQPPVTPVNQMAAKMAESSSAAKPINSQQIINTPLFGKPAEKQVINKPQPIKPAVVAKTPLLRIALIGTVVAGKDSGAILTTANDSRQRFIRLHADIADSVILSSVFADAIEVRDHGRLRRISLRKKSEQNTASPAAPRQNSQLPPPPPLPGSMVQHSVDRSMIQRETRNFSRLLSQARVLPNFKNGKADGFVISQIQPRSLFQKIGLRNGDIIRKVNQEVISDAGQAMKLYQSLQNASEIQLEVERAGQTHTINYHIH